MPLKTKRTHGAATRTHDLDLGVVIRKRVYLDDLDSFGMVHHSRFALLVDNAVLDYWHDAGWVPDPATGVQAVRELTITYHAPIVRVGDVDVHIWIDHVGESSVNYRFRLLSPDQTTLYAEGSRVLVNLDPTTRRPAPLMAQFHNLAGPLLA